MEPIPQKVVRDKVQAFSRSFRVFFRHRHILRQIAQIDQGGEIWREGRCVYTQHGPDLSQPMSPVRDRADDRKIMQRRIDLFV